MPFAHSAWNAAVSRSLSVSSGQVSWAARCASNAVHSARPASRRTSPGSSVSKTSTVSASSVPNGYWAIATRTRTNSSPSTRSTSGAVTPTLDEGAGGGHREAVPVDAVHGHVRHRAVGRQQEEPLGDLGGQQALRAGGQVHAVHGSGGRRRHPCRLAHCDGRVRYTGFQT